MTAYKLTPIGEVPGVTEIGLAPGEMSLGSDSVCEARVVADGVAAVHAAIYISQDAVFVEPVQGTLLVNDEPVQGRTQLPPGAFIWIGEPPAGVLMQFSEAPAGAAAGAPAASEAAEPDGAGTPVEVLESVDESNGAEIGQNAIIEGSDALDGPLTSTGTDAVEALEYHEAAEAKEVEGSPAAGRVPASTGEVASVEAIDHEFDPEPVQAQAPPAPWLAAAPAAEAPVDSDATMLVGQAAPPQPKEFQSAWEVKQSPPPEPTKPAQPDAPPSKPDGRTDAKPPAVPAPPATTGSAPRPKAVAPPKVTRAPIGAQIPQLPAKRSGPNPALLGAAGLLGIVGLIGAYFALRPAQPPTPVAQATPPPPVATPPLEAQTPTPELAATLEPATEPPVTPTPPPAATVAAPTPRTTPTPARPTPSPRSTPTPAGGRPVATPPLDATVAGPAAPVSPVPRLLDEMRSAIAARDWAQAQRAADEVLRVEPGNAEAGARRPDIAARLAARSRGFSTSSTSVTGARASGRGPAGFDVGGATVAQSDYMGQIACAAAPVRVDMGEAYSVDCSLQNTGKKSFKVESVQIVETVDGARRNAAGLAPRGDIAVQQRVGVAEVRGTWSASRDYRLEVTVRTDKNTSFSASVSWR